MYGLKRTVAFVAAISILAISVAGCDGRIEEPSVKKENDIEDVISIMTEDVSATESLSDDEKVTDSSDKNDISDDIKEVKDSEEETEEAEGELKTKYDIHGALHVNNKGKLCDHNGEIVTLHGYSTHSINIYDEYVNRPFLEYMRDEWKIDVIRLAMYTDDQNGYCVSGDENKAHLMEVIDRGVKAATELGLYVIIDWHILSDPNPNIHADQAIDFFDKVSSKYSSYGNIIYEICNEPNSGCSWDDIRSYSERVIPVIRKNDPYSVILVGTPNWSQRLDEAVARPITTDDNIMYVLHFYADTHRDDLRNICQNALNSDLPIFVSEFGTCAADGNGGHNAAEADKWIELLDKNDISYVMWNISNKNETSAMIMPECDNHTGPYDDSQLRESAKWYRNKLLRKDDQK